MIQKTSTIKTIQKFNNFITEVKKIINREKEKKEKEFVEFIKKIENSIDNKKNKRYEKFKNFIKEAKETIQKDKANKERDFKIFIEKVNKILQDKEKESEKHFRNFINKVEEYIIKEVENWSDSDEELFEIYNEKQETNIFEGFDNEGTYRDFLVWLLEPKNSHQLGDKFLKYFIYYIAKEKYNLLNIKLEFEDIEIEKEKLGIDFIIKGKNFYCAVEMKLWGGAGDKQLGKYKEDLGKDLNYEKKEHKFKICLDPKEYKNMEEKKKEIETAGFKLMDWWELSKLLVEIYKEANDDVKSLIRQFIKQMFNFAQERNNFAKREEMLKKKRWFEIYQNKKRRLKWQKRKKKFLNLMN
ncbi:MAG: PD-(D/E)XK nuclease family protein [candidate division WOR-3 bacterium]